ncbi:DUF6447 family protein [Prochlorococcus marinus]|uniref:DUF6447 family protein n=1 Tax=Prochlorococcus marinus TaxID=1219 RepID=UPI0022B2E774|nr:DUF6447 family protein [Prochlorococcus marinus]
MPTITIDDKEYNLDDLSNQAKEQLASIQFVQGEIKKLEGQIAVYKTAYAAYTSALKSEIEE